MGKPGRGRHRKGVRNRIKLDNLQETHVCASVVRNEENQDDNGTETKRNERARLMDQGKMA